MLIELYGENFGCFRDRFQLSMLATDIEPGSDRGIVEVPIKGDDQPLRLLRCAAIYGPNASGKSTVLRAASSLRYLLATSARSGTEDPIRVHEPYMLDKDFAAEPSVLGAKFIADGVVYDYSCSFDDLEYHTERLVQLSPHDPIVLLDRRGQTVMGQWTSDSQFSLLAEAFRQNALLLSLADALTPRLAGKVAVGVRQVLSLFDNATNRTPLRSVHNSAVAQRVGSEPAFKLWLERRLQDADVGIASIDVRQHKIRQESSLLGHDPKDNSRFHLVLRHTAPDGQIPLAYHSESHGTRRFVELAPLLYDLVHGEGGRGFFVDELDSSIHPTLLKAIVSQFNNEVQQTDVRGQLVFSAHDVGLMDDEARSAPLRRDQIYFTEKDAAGAARLYSLAEFRERNNLNIRRRYLQGRYGALPSLGDFSE